MDLCCVCVFDSVMSSLQLSPARYHRDAVISHLSHLLPVILPPVSLKITVNQSFNIIKGLKVPFVLHEGGNLWMGWGHSNVVPLVSWLTFNHVPVYTHFGSLITCSNLPLFSSSIEILTLAARKFLKQVNWIGNKWNYLIPLAELFWFARRTKQPFRTQIWSKLQL